MKKYFLLLGVIFLAWSKSPVAVNAQELTPPVASGEVTGKIINQNQGTVVAESLEVMLHISDKQQADLGMLHVQSQPDGTFMFTEVPLNPGQLYAVMTIYKDVQYYSDTVPAVDGSNKVELDVPVYETTTDLSAVQIDQMHVLFKFATDGLETTEIYLLSNGGQRTVKDAVTLENGKVASLRYPLPANADFIFFQPDEQGRYIKFPGGFGDTSPVLPGDRTEQLMVTYLVPWTQGQIYSYTAPINIKTMNFLLPKDAGVSLVGAGLSGPQPVTVESGTSYLVYSYSNVTAGQTIQVTFSGKPFPGSPPKPGNLALPLALGGGVLGLVMAGVGVWWYLRPEDVADEVGEMEIHPGVSTLDALIDQIARMDEAFDRGELNIEKYHSERRRLREQAKAMMDQQENL